MSGNTPPGLGLTLVLSVTSCAVLAQVPDSQQSATQATREQVPGERSIEEIVRLQVRLDRAGFSTGEIDGKWGDNSRKALESFAAARSLAPSSIVEAAAALAHETGEIAETTTYTITDADAAGPFAETIPAKLEDQAELPVLTYRTLREALAERFHCSEKLLDALNPGARYVAGETLMVPHVEPMPVVAPPFTQTIQRAAEAGRGGANGRDGGAGRGGGDTSKISITVARGTGRLTVRRNDVIVLDTPATTGSEHDPLPLGDWAVVAIVREPQFHYNPELFWDAEPGDKRATLKPGPNNPVGLVWIDLTREHYGIHGTPAPAAVGHTESHGCVRLTNWDVLRVAALVAPGTPVHFVQ